MNAYKYFYESPLLPLSEQQMGTHENTSSNVRLVDQQQLGCQQQVVHQQQVEEYQQQMGCSEQVGLPQSMLQFQQKLEGQPEPSSKIITVKPRWTKRDYFNAMKEVRNQSKAKHNKIDEQLQKVMPARRKHQRKTKYPLIPEEEMGIEYYYYMPTIPSDKNDNPIDTGPSAKRIKGEPEKPDHDDTLQPADDLMSAKTGMQHKQIETGNPKTSNQRKSKGQQ